MLPNSRGKRILELSLKTSAPKRHKQVPPSHPIKSSTKDGDAADLSILDISPSQLIDVPEDADMSFSFDESFSVINVPDLSSSLKVANFVLNHVNDNVLNTDACTSCSGSGNTDKADNVQDNISAVPHGEAVEHTVVTDLCNVNQFNFNEQASNTEENPGLDQNISRDDARTFQETEPTNTERSENEPTNTENLEDEHTNTEKSDVAVGTPAADVVCPRANLNNEQPEIAVDIFQEEPRNAKKLTKKEEKKKNRQHGKAYTGRYLDKEQNKFIEVMRAGKVLGERCNCKAVYYKCKQISDEDRKNIHSDVWQMTWAEKIIYLRGSVEAKDVNERKGNAEHSRRNKSLYFTLRGSTGTFRVCKEMYLNTTGFRSWWVMKNVTKDSGVESQEDSEDAPTKSYSKRTEPSAGRLFIKQFLDRLPKMPAHYCRKDTSKMYLESVFKSYADVYKEYVKACNSEGISAMSMTVFMENFKSRNLSIFIPRKDQCDLCCEYAQGNATEEVYLAHREKKEAAQAEKAKDKEQPENSRTKVICMDVQRVLLSPYLKASALYFKTKLQVHNYTLYDLITKDVTCFVWNESEGGLTANEFASCLVLYLMSKKESFDKVIIYSDGCTYQNRNRMMGTALRWFSVKYNKIIEQKILERGHTQMEVDSVHATIERRLKHVDIFSPLDYVQSIQAARVNPKPNEVQYLKYDFFLDFENYGEGAVKSLKPGKDSNVTDICALKYSPDGSISYKLCFTNDWLLMGRRNKLPSSTPSQLYNSRRKIKKTKYDHLQSLKSVLPMDVHTFYDSLPHT